MTKEEVLGKKPLHMPGKMRLGVTRMVVIALAVIIVVGGVVAAYIALQQSSPSPSPTPTPVSSPTPTPTSSPSPSASPTSTPTPTSAPTPTPTPTSAPTPTPTPSPTSTPKPTPTFNLVSSLYTVESGGSITLTGTLSLPKSGTVDLAYAIGSSGFIYHRSDTLTDGVFTDSFGFLDLTTWQFKATWSGDETSNPAESNVVTVTVIKATPTFILTADPTTVTVNGATTLTGTLSLPKTGSVDLYWAIGSSGFIYHTVETLNNGLFSRSFGFTQAGSWQFKVTYQGDSTTNAVTSNTVTVNVNP